MREEGRSIKRRRVRKCEKERDNERNREIMREIER